MTSEDSEVVDLYAICARAPASPAGDLRPPDLFSIAPPYTRDIAAGADGEPTLTSMLKRPRVRVALAGAAGIALLMGLVVGVRSAAPQAREASVVAAAPPPPPAEPEEAPVSLPAAAAVKLPPPPTTGAPAAASPPPRAVAMRKAPAAAVPVGPKMTKIRSDGSVVR